MRAVNRTLILLAGASSGCDVEGEFRCVSASQCRHGETVGFCEVGALCSFTDVACPSQHRYAESIGAVGGQCVADAVSGRIRELFAVNDANFAPLVMERALARETLTIAARLDSGVAVPVDYRDDGTFSFSVSAPGQGYSVIVSVGNTSTEYQHSLPHLELVERAVGRPTRGSLTMPTTTQFRYTTNPGNNAVVVTTGLWTETSTGGGASSFDFTWNTAVSLSGPRGLLDNAQNDRLYFTKRSSQTGYNVIGAVNATTFKQSDGGTNTVNGALSTAALDECRHVVVPGTSEYSRLTTAMPGTYTGSRAWDVVAVPSPDRLGMTGALNLIDGTPGAIADLDVIPTFHNPFVGTQLLATSRIFATFSINAPGAFNSLTIAHSSSAVAPFVAGANCGASLARLATTAGIPGAVRVGGTAVDANNKPVTLALSKPVPISWSLVAPGPADTFVVELHELALDSNDATTSSLITTIKTVTTSALIDASQLVSGHTYILAITAVTGSPGAAAGDFEPITYPTEAVRIWSSSFLVL